MFGAIAGPRDRRSGVRVDVLSALAMLLSGRPLAVRRRVAPLGLLLGLAGTARVLGGRLALALGLRDFDLRSLAPAVGLGVPSARLHAGLAHAPGTLAAAGQYQGGNDQERNNAEDNTPSDA
jgi:hypothetical protein